MTDYQTVTQADERAADEWYPDRSATMHRKLAKLLARHRTAHSGDLALVLERAAQWHDARCKGPSVFEQELHEVSAKALRHLAANPGATDMQALDVAQSGEGRAYANGYAEAMFQAWQAARGTNADMCGSASEAYQTVVSMLKSKAEKASHAMLSGEGRSNGAGEDEPLGRFGHHPDPATDFCEEVTHLESIVTDKELGLRADEGLPLDRIARAMTFRVGGDPIAVGAKNNLREIEGRANALTALSAPQGDKAILKELRPSKEVMDKIDRMEKANAAGLAALRDMPFGSAASPASGAGMRLVPVEPTEAMYLAAFNSDHWGGVQPIRRVVDEIWSSMLAAALAQSEGGKSD